MQVSEWGQTFLRQNRERRTLLLTAMAQLSDEGRDCRLCSGVCCTFVANSMQTTPLETLDILVGLWQENRLNQALVQDLRTCIRRYRLDQPPPSDGRRTFLRRNYTCPFFSGTALGCSLDPHIKPYGCLGFNPQISNQTEGGRCSSNQLLLQDREKTWTREEQRLNRIISQALDIDWDKSPMPLALLRLIACFEDTHHLLATPIDP